MSHALGDKLTFASTWTYWPGIPHEGDTWVSDVQGIVYERLNYWCWGNHFGTASCTGDAEEAMLAAEAWLAKVRADV